MQKTRVFVGFNIGDSMFEGKEDCLILRRNLSFPRFKEYLEKKVISCLNISHGNTIRELEKRYGISLPVPEVPPRIKLKAEDSFIVISSRGLPRKTGNVVEFTPEELKRAIFKFSIYILLNATS